MVVPMFCPITKAMAMSKPIQPLVHIIRVMAIAAELDCTMAVNTAPITMKIRMERNFIPDSPAIAERNSSFWLKSGMASCRSCRPISRTASPMMNSLRDFILLRFIIMKGRAAAARASGSTNLPNESPMPSSIIHEVMVVPMLAPITTAMAPARLSSPELTKLTTITVVADDDCTAAVTAAPVRMPLTGLFVIRPRMLRMRLPAIF